MNTLALSGRLLLRQGRSGALGLLTAGLIVATAALVAVSLFTDRVSRGLDRQAGEALAADLAVSGRDRLPAEFREQAESLGLETAEIILISTVLFAGEESHLIDIKGVSGGYPLRGALRLADRFGDPDESVRAIPEAGTGWMEPRGLRLLEIDTSQTIELGRSELEVTRVLTYEPDRGGSRFMLAPRFMVNLEDLLASELLGPGARARFRLLVAGPERQISAFRDWVEPRLDDQQGLITVDEAGDRTGEALEQARRFLGMAALTAVILAAVAILLSAGRFSRAQRDLVALLKAFGATGNQVMTALSLMLLWLVLAAVVIGGLAGLIAQGLIAAILVDNPAGPLPPPRLAPLLGGGLFTLLLAGGFALPPLMNLRGVPPMRILNRSLDTAAGLGRGLWLLPIAGALAIPVVQLGDLKLAMIVLGASGVLAGLLVLAGWGAMAVTRALSRRARATWRFGLAGLDRRRGAGVIQVTALGLGLMALLLLMIVRGELMDQWRGSLPADTPDHFLVNIQPDQFDAVRNQLLTLNAHNLQIRPMANANLIEISGDRPPDHRFTGQVNVSWTADLPPANEIVAGKFWEPGDAGEISLALRWAEHVGVGLGDELTFESGAQRFSATVTSIREVDWNSFNANFFILLTPEAGEVLPHQFIASFYLPGEAVRELQHLTRAFPNVSVLDIGALIERIGEIIDQVSRAAQVVFFFTLLAGLVVLLAALEATRDERRAESALIRTLGADNALVRGGLLIEYGVMALIAGSLASLGAAATGWLLARELFNFSYQPSPLLFVAGFGCSLILVVGAGWLGNRSVLKTPPVRVLRAQRP